MNELIHYIKKVTGLQVEVLEKPPEVLQGLPLFIREGYTFICANFFNHQIVFVQPKEEDVTPGRLQKLIPKIESAFECHAVLVFDEIAYYLKERLIKSRISFIVPGKQLFIPFMFMDLNEQKNIRKTKTESFTPAAQCILFYNLWIKPLEGLNFQEIADIFRYTPRTIGRCAEELKIAGACSIVGGKSKYLKFEKNGKEIWNSVHDYMVAPIKKTVWLSHSNNIEKAIISGLEALSHYSNINAGDLKSYAIDAKVYNKQLNRNEINPSFYNDDNVQLEIWSYDPTILTKDNFVDPFSLYMSFAEDHDERIQIELENMINRIL